MKRHGHLGLLAMTVATVALASPAAAVPDLGAMPHLARTLAYHIPLADPIAEEIRLDITQEELSRKTADDTAFRALAKFYEERNWAPAWTDKNGFTAGGMTLIEAIANADEDGLDPSAYILPQTRFTAAHKAEPRILAVAELTLVRAALAYAHDAQGGRFKPKSISGYINAEPTFPEPLSVLEALARAPRPANVLVAYNPPHMGSRKLKEKLAELRATEAVAEKPIRVPAGAAMRLGISDKRVPLLRKRLSVPTPTTRVAAAETVQTDAAPANPDPLVFDEALDTAVREFQKTAGLSPDGIVGPNTLRHLNGPADANPVADIVANMERWRWLPRKLGRFHVHVNIPEYLVRVNKNGRTVHQTRVVVGKPTNQTPIFSDEMEHIVVNPYWNVPVSIARKEMLPGIQANPGSYFARRGYEVVYNGRVIDPTAVAWTPENVRKVRIRQRPGARNALGRIKFMFPNRHSVYLHDTPSKSLFQRDARAFSHGCVRVNNPLDFADAILADNADWNSTRIKKLFGRSERRIDLPRHIPVHITYFTTLVDQNGELRTLRDIYGHNARVKAKLGL